MAVYFWNSDYFAARAMKLAQTEQRFTHTQLEYLRQYYIWNRFPKREQLKEILKRWNIDDFDYLFDLRSWFTGQFIGEQEILQRREEARKLAA